MRFVFLQCIHLLVGGIVFWCGVDASHLQLPETWLAGCVSCGVVSSRCAFYGAGHVVMAVAGRAAAPTLSRWDAGRVCRGSGARGGDWKHAVLPG